MLELRQLQSELVWTYDLDFDFVRREYATILDPSPHTAQLCNSLVEKNQIQSLKDELKETTL